MSRFDAKSRHYIRPSTFSGICGQVGKKSSHFINVLEEMFSELSRFPRLYLYKSLLASHFTRNVFSSKATKCTKVHEKMLRSLTSNNSIETKRVKTYKKLCSEELNFYPSSELILIRREENGQGRTQVIINTQNLN